VAEPVLLELGYVGCPADDQWPRLWWCPVGPMAFLPLHAAGYHDREATPGAAVLDRVVSSYTATIQSLAYSRSRPAGPDLSSALIVGLPQVDGEAELPAVRDEISSLGRLLPGRTLLEGVGANKSAVLDALPAHAIAHFACHSLSDADDPGSSLLVLSDYVDAPLTVAGIAGLELAKARLAYLSACATSHTTPSMADEAVHITSAFQLAGYPQVIGTLWPVVDSVARAVALDVYGQLTGEGAGEADPALSALALHRAIRRVRAKRRRRPSTWAAYVHVGANPAD
jgi:CHAT domain-containing protein